MHRPSWGVRQVDRQRPDPGRASAVRALADWPERGRVLRADRAFLRRAVRYLSTVGVDQFLDLVAGMPTVGDVREVVREVHDGARVVGVDVDPQVVAHAEVVLADDPRADVMLADALDAPAVLAGPQVGGLLDLHRPVGVLAVGWRHRVDDDRRLGDTVARYRDAPTVGSHVALTHVAARSTAEEADEPAGTPRTPEQVAALPAGFEIVEPGVVPAGRWRPDEAGDVPAGGVRGTGLAAVGRRV